MTSLIVNLARAGLALSAASLLVGASAAPASMGHMSMPMSHAKPAPLPALSAAMVKVTGAYVAAQPPVATETAAFMTITNTGKVPLTLLGGSAAGLGGMLMTFAKLPSGQMSMKMVDKFVIAPGKTLSLTPGGNHLMLSGLKTPLKVGAAMPLTLRFAQGTLKVPATVRKF